MDRSADRRGTESNSRGEVIALHPVKFKCKLTRGNTHKFHYYLGARPGQIKGSRDSAMC